jgi:hypothetical protein
MKTYTIKYEPVIVEGITYQQWNIYYYIDGKEEVKLNYGTLDNPLEPIRFGYTKTQDSL